MFCLSTLIVDGLVVLLNIDEKKADAGVQVGCLKRQMLGCLNTLGAKTSQMLLPPGIWSSSN